MINKEEQYDVVVCGGGLAGFCAAVASARLGSKTCIIQNRPVFGGNSSSEIGVTPHGAAAFHAYARETGIISELLIEERAKNHVEIYENGWTNSVWDMVLYDMVISTDNLYFHLNTDIREVLKKDDRTIEAVIGHTQNAEVALTIKGKIFIDSTGDGIVADKSGCEWRMGSEGRGEFNEPHAPTKANDDVMGNSIHFLCRNTGRPSSFKAPDWAIKFDDPDYFYKKGRLPKDERGGFWWLEIGIPYHTIYDNEKIRHELTRYALGVWDWMKNNDPLMKERAENYVLDWIGQVPGKRESRRIIGKYFMNEHDVLDKTIFDDEIAFGGWFVDLHTPGGLLAETSEITTSEGYSTTTDYAVKSYCGPYGIPLRILMAKDVDNLMMAGRNVSVTHAALGTVRVMSTTSLMGQAAGTAAAIALQNNYNFEQVISEGIQAVKQTLLRNGCFLPNYKNEDPDDEARKAAITASSEASLYGAGPESKGYHEGLNIWTDQPQYELERLEMQKGQIIAVGEKPIDTIAVCLDNHSDIEQEVLARIYNIDHIWDYRSEPGIPLIEGSLRVSPGYAQWISWNVNLNHENGLKKSSYIRIDLLKNENLSWKVAGTIIPGHTGMYEIAKDKMRRFGSGATLSFRLKPEQNCFSPENVINGVTRPHRFTNLWRSDPNIPLSQWIELAWPESQTIKAIHLTFPGHLIREYHAYGPFYHDPQCPKDYDILAKTGNEFKPVLQIKDNYQRHRKHVLPEKINTDKIRIEIKSTSGDPSAAIYEIRCY